MIGFIGAGNMGGAIVSGMVRSGKYAPESICVCDKAISGEIAELGVGIASMEETVAGCDYIILAVKPGVLPEVLKQISGFSGISEKVFVSIAAGVKLSAIEQHLKGCRVIRVMPNLCLRAGEGMTVIAPNGAVSAEELGFAENIFACSGKTAVDREDLIDACTAISGSGPAYVFMFIEALADAGVKQGIDRKTAYLLASQTLLGSAALCMESGLHPGELKDMVCSPGGTTIEAVEALERCGMRASVMEAVNACAQKARKLGE